MSCVHLVARIKLLRASDVSAMPLNVLFIFLQRHDALEAPSLDVLMSYYTVTKKNYTSLCCLGN